MTRVIVAAYSYVESVEHSHHIQGHESALFLVHSRNVKVSYFACEVTFHVVCRLKAGVALFFENLRRFQRGGQSLCRLGTSVSQQACYSLLVATETFNQRWVLKKQTKTHCSGFVSTYAEPYLYFEVIFIAIGNRQKLRENIEVDMSSV